MHCVAASALLPPPPFHASAMDPVEAADSEDDSQPPILDAFSTADDETAVASPSGHILKELKEEETASCSGSHDKASPFPDEESSKDASEAPATLNGKRRSSSDKEEREDRTDDSNEDVKRPLRRKRNGEPSKEAPDGKVVVVVDKAQRKSNRINKMHSTEPTTVAVKEIIRLQRVVDPPRGSAGRRVRYNEKYGDTRAAAAKEQRLAGNLQIAMVDGSPKPQKRDKHILVGADYQIDPASIESITKPDEKNYEDRDTPMWMDCDSVTEHEEELDALWKAVRRQFNGDFPLDSVMRRFMLCDYDVDRTLATLEEELFTDLVQPFEPLTVAQRAEFEKACRLRNAGLKRFRNLNDKHLKEFYLGEIITHYYNTKNHCCVNYEFTPCQCRNKVDTEPPTDVSRVECANCSEYIWKEEKASRLSPPKYCLLCQLYFQRNKSHRPVRVPNLNSEEEELARRWARKERDEARACDEDAVRREAEEERLKAIPVMKRGETAEKHERAALDVVNPRCPVLRPQLTEIRKAILCEFSMEEKEDMVKAFFKHGHNIPAVAKEVSRTRRDIESFYANYFFLYRLDMVATARDSKPVLSSPVQPETNGRRRRVAESPEYESRTNSQTAPSTRTLRAKPRPTQRMD